MIIISGGELLRCGVAVHIWLTGDHSAMWLGLRTCENFAPDDHPPPPQNKRYATGTIIIVCSMVKDTCFIG
jgi:hypothetical protein